MSTSIHLPSVGGLGWEKFRATDRAVVVDWVEGVAAGFGLTVGVELAVGVDVTIGDGVGVCVAVADRVGALVGVGASVRGSTPANVTGVASGGLNGFSATCGSSKMMRNQIQATPINTRTIALRNSNRASE